MLALGAAFLSQSTQYEPEIFSLLFGEILGVSANEIVPTSILAVLCLVAVAMLYRPLMLTSVVPEMAAARGLRPDVVEMAFLLVVACATTMTVPVVGALLIFSLMIGPPAAARSFTDRPVLALALSVVLAVVIVWTSIACSYWSNWPVGFFVATLSAGAFCVGRVYAAARLRGFRPFRRSAVPALID
jgi:zinc/manganese transport system permease protein